MANPHSMTDAGLRGMVRNFAVCRDSFDLLSRIDEGVNSRFPLAAQRCQSLRTVTPFGGPHCHLLRCNRSADTDYRTEERAHNSKPGHSTPAFPRIPKTLAAHRRTVNVRILSFELAQRRNVGFPVAQACPDRAAPRGSGVERPTGRTTWTRAARSGGRWCVELYCSVHPADTAAYLKA
jgi:hypothetical protein